MTGHKAAIYALAPDASSKDHFFSAGGDGWIVRWDITTPEHGQLVATTSTQLFALHPLPTAKLLVAGTMNGGIHWIDPVVAEATRNISHHSHGTFSFLQIGTSFYSGGGKGLITRWSFFPDIRSVDSLRITDKSVRCMIHDPGSDALFAGCSDGAIHVIDPKSMSVVNTIANADSHSVFCLALTTDGKYLLSGGRDAQLRIWDLHDNLRLADKIAAHWFTINAIAIHPNLPIFATASRDKAVKIWSAQNFELLKVLHRPRIQGHLNSVNRLLWITSDTLLSAGDDRTIIAWAVNMV